MRDTYTVYAICPNCGEVTTINDIPSKKLSHLHIIEKDIKCNDCGLSLDSMKPRSKVRIGNKTSFF